jgi:O-antigen ligase
MQIIYSKLSLFFLTSFPIFALIIRGWTSAVLFFYLLISILYLVKNQSLSFSVFREEFYKKDHHLLFIAVPFFFPIVSILYTSFAKQIFNWADLDGPSRYFFAIIFLLFLLRYKPNIEKYLIFSITLMPVMTAVLIAFFEKKDWTASGLTRTTIYFIDPITFGSLCLSFGLLSLVLISEKQTHKSISIWYGLSMLCGFCLSISSESRTGWLAVPFAIFLILKIRLGISYIRTLILSAFIIAMASFALYQSSDIFHSRLNMVAEELNSYQWDEGNNSTSIGERISYIRMGWHLIFQKPLTGWANLDLTPELESPSFSKFANSTTRLGVKGGGFHNEFINNGVKFGILGFVYSALLFLGPALFFFRILKNQNNNRYALIAIVYIAAQAISSLSYQVLDFKFTTSLYALMIVTLAYAALSNQKTIAISGPNSNITQHPKILS